MVWSRNKQILVLGIGNILLADDGVGVHIVRRLAAGAPPAWVHTVDGGTMGFRLTAVLRDAGDVLIIDAAELSAAPGTIRLLDEATVTDHLCRVKKSSAHEAGLADLLALLRLEGFAPRRLAVLAVQPQTVDWGESLSPAVEQAVLPACALINETAAAWRFAA